MVIPLEATIGIFLALLLPPTGTKPSTTFISTPNKFILDPLTTSASILRDAVESLSLNCSLYTGFQLNPELK